MSDDFCELSVNMAGENAISGVKNVDEFWILALGVISVVYFMQSVHPTQISYRCVDPKESLSHVIPYLTEGYCVSPSVTKVMMRGMFTVTTWNHKLYDFLNKAGINLTVGFCTVTRHGVSSLDKSSNFVCHVRSKVGIHWNPHILLIGAHFSEILSTGGEYNFVPVGLVIAGSFFFLI